MKHSNAVDYTILLIEDNPEHCAQVALAFMVAAPNVRLCIARGRDETQAYLSGAEIYADRDAFPVPQLLLLALDLSEKSSFAILEWLRAEPSLKQIPVIALTSSAESGDIDRAYALGVNSCLLKSLDEEALHDVAKGIGDYAVLLKNRFDPDFIAGGVKSGRADRVESNQ